METEMIVLGVTLGVIVFILYRYYYGKGEKSGGEGDKPKKRRGVRSVFNKIRAKMEEKPSWTPNLNRFESYDDLVAGIKEAGLESSNLVIGVDFTKSNNWTGRNSFGGRSLHYISDVPNPYEMVIEIMGKTLEPFDDDHYIPAYIFGDNSTTDKFVLPFYPNNKPCFGFQEVLTRYRELAQSTTFSGPTSFAPIINETIKIVEQVKSYHILLIIADGQVTNERETAEAIVRASQYPISIVVVGVGDGPWDMMEEFDDKLPKRKFDNFQFVSFHEILTRYDGNPVAFALQALMEIPDQYQSIKRLGLLEKVKSL